MKPGHAHVSSACRPINELLSQVGDKWTSLIITRLSTGPMRFNALKRSVDGISQKMLTSTLKSLERDGFVERTVFPTVPPGVEYALTPFGRELSVPLMALARFAFENSDRVDAARAAYDGRQNGAAGELQNAYSL